jgi:hypothetical protein
MGIGRIRIARKTNLRLEKESLASDACEIWCDQAVLPALKSFALFVAISHSFVQW